jgi:hypothetical protein
MSNVIKNVSQVLCLMQLAMEKLEELPEDNIFVEANKPQIEEFIKFLEGNVESLTEVMTIKQSDNYIYICRNMRKVIDKIKLL